MFGVNEQKNRDDFKKLTKTNRPFKHVKEKKRSANTQYSKQKHIVAKLFAHFNIYCWSLTAEIHTNYKRISPIEENP